MQKSISEIDYLYVANLVLQSITVVKENRIMNLNNLWDRNLKNITEEIHRFSRIDDPVLSAIFGK